MATRSRAKLPVAATIAAGIVALTVANGDGAPVSVMAASTVRENTTSYCQAGSGFAAEGRVDCTDARSSVLAEIANGLLPALGVSVPIDLADLNSAASVTLLGLADGRRSTITGDGFATALAAARGTASANAVSAASVASAVGVLGESRATSGLLGLSAAVILPQVSSVFGAGLLIFASPAGSSSADATLGAAIALNTGERVVRTSVLGGIGTATADGDRANDRVTCAAIVCESSIEGGPSTRSWLVVLAMDNSGVDGAPTLYRVRDPFSARLAPIATPGLRSTAEFASSAPTSLVAGALPPALRDVLGSIDLEKSSGLIDTPVALEFARDIVRVVSGGEGDVFRVESDVPVLRELLQVFWPRPVTSTGDVDVVERGTATRSATSAVGADDRSVRRSRRSTAEPSSPPASTTPTPVTKTSQVRPAGPAWPGRSDVASAEPERSATTRDEPVGSPDSPALGETTRSSRVEPSASTPLAPRGADSKDSVGGGDRAPSPTPVATQPDRTTTTTEPVSSSATPPGDTAR